MSDLRRINFWRTRRWGDARLTLATITGDDTYIKVHEVITNFTARETRDEANAETRQLFEFRLYGNPQLAIDLTGFDLLLFSGRRLEVVSKELKKQRRSYVEITAKVIGVEK